MTLRDRVLIDVKDGRQGRCMIGFMREVDATFHGPRLTGLGET
jgi:hypothetical protein